MARGRMLNNRISRNKDVAKLGELAGGWGLVFYTWMIPHLDCEGRIHGDPLVLKGLVCPRLGWVTSEVIDETVSAAHDLGLLNLYEVDGECYIEFPSFADNQTGLRKSRERPSEIPPPGDGVTPEGFRSNDGDPPISPGEVKGIEGKGSRREVEEKGIAPVSLNTTQDQTQAIGATTLVFEAWWRHHPEDEVLTPPLNGNIGRGVRRLINDGTPLAHILEAIEGMHQSGWRKSHPGSVTLWNVVKPDADLDALRRHAQEASKPKLDTKTAGTLGAVERFANQTTEKP